MALCLSLFSVSAPSVPSNPCGPIGFSFIIKTSLIFGFNQEILLETKAGFYNLCRIFWKSRIWARKDLNRMYVWALFTPKIGLISRN
ncbi:MAG: hypothetical protein CV087_20365 [Candidatus Brocadia sp. WS118]|nr:MAG: hypothetical protein CV087_20365 [Candidatus Brocadia sp. WS118]